MTQTRQRRRSAHSWRHSMIRLAGCTLMLLLSVMPATSYGQASGASGPATKVVQLHGLSMYGDLKYGPDFQHFDYVNPSAPKGGALRLAAQGTFDNLNPYILRGVSAPGLGMTFDTLLVSSSDEAFSEYGLLAESMEMPEDRSYIVFTLRREARFHDGAPVTAEDVVFTFTTLMSEGHPFYRAYYADVAEVTAEASHRVRFTFKAAGNRELPLIVGQMPVLPRHAWSEGGFGSTTLRPILGSGPYRVAAVDPGRRITYERVADWWAKDLPVARGQYNFDTITYDLYRDQSVLLQAFFAGQYDIRQENIAKAWTDEYGHPAVLRGDIIKEEIPHDIPTGMQAFAFNVRRPVFADPLVREALTYAFDFEWSNANFASGTYKRTASYFENSELASEGRPQGQVRDILERVAARFPGSVPARVFDEDYKNPVTTGNGHDVRQNLLVARDLLRAAGWQVNARGKLEKDGQPLTFEILLNSSSFERWTLPFIGNLRKLGIEARLRTVDTAQYQNRMDNFDYDMTVVVFPQSLSPGNEQRDFWHSAKADEKGSRNLIGIANPAVDALIDGVINANTRADLIAHTQALDLVLLWHFYVIPQWHIDYHRVAYWNFFGRPETPAKYNLGMTTTWWYDADKAGAQQRRGRRTGPLSGQKAE